MHNKLIRSCLWNLLIVMFYLAKQPVYGINIELGPSLGLGGHMSHYLAPISKNSQSNPKISNLSGNAGGFAKIGISLLYAKSHLLFQVEKFELTSPPSQKSEALNRFKDSFKAIVVPLELGLSLFDTLRPHIGLTFKVPLKNKSDLNRVDNPSKELVREICKESLDHFFYGIGVDFIGLLIDLRFEHKIEEFSIKPGEALFGRDSHNKSASHPYTPKKISFTLSYNLLKLWQNRS